VLLYRIKTFAGCILHATSNESKGVETTRKQPVKKQVKGAW